MQAVSLHGSGHPLSVLRRSIQRNERARHDGASWASPCIAQRFQHLVRVRLQMEPAFVIRLVRSAVIDRPPREVFDFLADCRSEEIWDPDTISVTKLTDGPVGLGTKFRDVNKLSGRPIEMIWDTVVHEPPSRVVRYGDNGVMRVRSGYRIEPVGNDARVTVELEAELLGARRFLEPLAALLMRR